MTPRTRKAQGTFYHIRPALSMAATYFNQIMGGGNELLPEFAPPSWKNLTMKHYIYTLFNFVFI